MLIIERENQCDSLVISKVVIESLSQKDKSIDNYILCCLMTVKSRLQQEQLALLNRLKGIFVYGYLYVCYCNIDM